MDISSAIDALSALAHERRLAAFRLLVQTGPQGRPAGDIAAALDIPNNTLSTHLAALTRSGLLTSRRDGRHIYYRVNFDGMRALLGFLMEDCCQVPSSVAAQELARVGARCGASTTDKETAL